MTEASERRHFHHATKPVLDEKIKHPPDIRLKYVDGEASTEGMKFDDGKARFDLLPPDALWEVVRVYTFGAKKYNDRNWEKGIKWGRVFAAICRHLFSWLKGEDCDEESSIHHLAHATWGCLTLLAYVLRGMNSFDDRFLPAIKEEVNDG